jgi:hypothetical protein
LQYIGHACGADVHTCEAAMMAAGCSSHGGGGTAACTACAMAHSEQLMDANCTAMYLDYLCSSHHHTWVSLGGYWYNTQEDGECLGDATPGDGESQPKALFVGI